MEIIVTLHTTKGDEKTAFPIGQASLASSLAAQYAADGKPFTMTNVSSKPKRTFHPDTGHVHWVGQEVDIQGMAGFKGAGIITEIDSSVAFPVKVEMSGTDGQELHFSFKEISPRE